MSRSGSGGMRTSSFFSSRSSNSSSSAGSSPLSRSSNERSTSVTVSSNEMSKIFETINSVSIQLTEQRAILQKLAKAQVENTERIKNLQEENRAVMEKLEESFQMKGDDDEGFKVPPEISNDVHLLYNSLKEEEQYKPEESLLSKHNTEVRKGLEHELVANDKGYPLRFIKRAVVRYYETKRKLYIQSLPQNKDKTDQLKKDNKLRSRRKRLYKAREKVADESEKEQLKTLSYDYVSDEENGVGDNKGKWVVRPPAWRSEAANAFMKKVQGKVENSRDDRPRVTRVQGDMTERGRPKVITNWAVRQEAVNDQRSRSVSPSSVDGSDRSRSPSPHHSHGNSPHHSRGNSQQSPHETRVRRNGERSRSPSRSPSPSPVRSKGSRKQMPRSNSPERPQTRAQSKSPAKRRKTARKSH